MSKLEELKKWFKTSQENLNKEFEKRYKRIELNCREVPQFTAGELKEPEISTDDFKEPELFLNVYTTQENDPYSVKLGLVHFDPEEAKKKQAEDFVYKGTYKLVKVD